MKKIIAVLFSIYLSILVFASITNWSEICYRNYISNSSEEIEIISDSNLVDNSPKSGLNWNHILNWQIAPKLNFVLDNELFLSQKSQEFRNSYFFNNSKFKISFFNGLHYLKVQYNNTFFGKDDTKIQVIEGLDDEIRPLMAHSTELHYKLDLNRFKFSLFGKLKNLNFEQYQLAADPENFWENDVFSSTQISYEFINNIDLFALSNYKSDLNEADLYDHIQNGIGLEYNNKLNLSNNIFSKITYLNNRSEQIDDEKKHYFLSEFRFTKRFGNFIAGFVSYINRSCYDDQKEKILRISNLLRANIKYSYLTDKLQDSYLLFGIKYNQENMGNMFQQEINQYVYKNIYLNVSAQFTPELSTMMEGKIEYFLNPEKSVWISNEYSEQIEFHSQNIISIGSTLLF